VLDAIEPYNDERSSRALQPPLYLHPPTPASEFPQWVERTPGTRSIDDDFIHEQLRRSYEWQQQFIDEQKKRDERRLITEAPNVIETFDRASFAAQRQRAIELDEVEKRQVFLLQSLLNCNYL
jgi:hypothetical protein